MAGSKPGSHQDEITRISPRKSFVFLNSLTRSEGEREEERAPGQRGSLQLLLFFFLPAMKTVSPNLASRGDRFIAKPLFPREPCLL